jgi:aspartate/methionine/tyrosine aminotransferase
LLSSEPSLSNVAEVYSLSKAYGVPGWRVGGVSGDARVVGLLSRLKSRVDYGLFLPIQMAAASALSVAEDLVRPTTEEYQKRCALLMEGLQKQGWELTCPSAAASVWARVPEEILSKYGDQSSRSICFTKELLSKHGVLLLPGVLFGESYDNFVRFALVRNDDGLREVLHRINTYSRCQ